jgi:hypothetical protein
MYDTLCVGQTHAGVMERKVLGSEVWQFLVVLSGFLASALLWLFVVYFPGRTLERWEDRRPRRGKAVPAAGRGGQDGTLKPES